MPSSPSGFMVLLALVAGIALPACAAGSSTPPAEFGVDRYEIVTGSAQRQTVLTGVLLGGAMTDVAVVTIDEAGDRRLRIFAFDEDGWVPRIDTTLRPEVTRTSSCITGSLCGMLTVPRSCRREASRSG